MPQNELPSTASQTSGAVRRKTKGTMPTPAVRTKAAPAKKTAPATKAAPAKKTAPATKAAPAKSPTVESGGKGKSSGAKTTEDQVGKKKKEKKDKKNKKNKKSGSPSR